MGKVKIVKEEIKNTKRNFKFIWSFIKKEKRQIFFVVFLTIILTVIGIIFPILRAQRILKLTNNLLTQLLLVAICIFFVEITRNVITYLISKITLRYTMEISQKIKLEMIDEIVKININEFEKNNTGTFINGINKDAEFVVRNFEMIFRDFTGLSSDFGIFVACFIISPPILTFFIVNSIIITLLKRKSRNKRFDGMKVFRKKEEKVSGLLTEFIRGIRDIKLLNGSIGIKNRVKKSYDELNDEALNAKDMNDRYGLLISCVRDLWDVLYIILVIILINYGYLTVANTLILMNYRSNIENLLNVYSRFIDDIKEFNFTADRLFEIMGDFYKKENRNGINLKNEIKSIEFKDLSFSYNDSNVLNNINLKISAGERIGFVGASGSGKSTIFNLISKLYSASDNQIFINNIDINKFSTNSIREHLSLIPQSSYIFNFSVMNNLKIGNPDVSDEFVYEACKRADIYDTIMKMENGFDTLLGEGGVILSGGEKQRLAIARCLIKDRNVLMFDEATSALDNITQDKVQKAIYKLDRNKTILIIAHRLSTIINCDKIVVMDDGKILDIGSHNELLERCKKYQKLYEYEQVQD